MTDSKELSIEIYELVEKFADLVATRVAEEIRSELRLHEPIRGSASVDSSRLELVRTQSAADCLGVKRRTMEKWRVIGGGPPFVKVGGRVLYELRELEDWVAKRRFRHTSEFTGPAASG